LVCPSPRLPIATNESKWKRFVFCFSRLLTMVAKQTRVGFQENNKNTHNRSPIVYLTE
jgi:hypothetical protein